MKNENHNFQRLIEMELHRLDMIASKLEARYGVGNLIDWMDEDFKTKWQRQMEKLASAVEENNPDTVRLVVDGCIRAWSMMEQNAKENGKPVNTPEFMEIKLDSGFHLRIAANVSEARQITSTGVYVWSLEEIARVLEKDYTLVNQIKNVFPDCKLTNVTKKKPFDFKNGDQIPF